jgi:hypothetical protein
MAFVSLDMSRPVRNSNERGATVCRFAVNARIVDVVLRSKEPKQIGRRNDAHQLAVPNDRQSTCSPVEHSSGDLFDGLVFAARGRVWVHNFGHRRTERLLQLEREGLKRRTRETFTVEEQGKDRRYVQATLTNDEVRVREEPDEPAFAVNDWDAANVVVEKSRDGIRDAVFGMQGHDIGDQDVSDVTAHFGEDPDAMTNLRPSRALDRVPSILVSGIRTK